MKYLAPILFSLCFALAAPAYALEDQDKDGIPDSVDDCPDAAEDLDGDQDEDGCPEDRDSDGDGIMDSVDLCPTLPEDIDHKLDTDGCPDLESDSDKDSIANDRDQCPYEPEDHDRYLDEDGCADPDNDGDEIADGFDDCPLVAEDPDGYQDTDGCPEYDNDLDLIPDGADKCPDEPEDFDGHDDEDGCPDLLVVRLKDKIQINERILFAHDDDEILPASFPVLNDVVQVMVDHPELIVRVEGHTDSVGEAEYNLELSERRAASVRRYLVEKGVASARLSSKGYGESKPINLAAGAEALQENRRVEFLIVSDEE